LDSRSQEISVESKYICQFVTECNWNGTCIVIYFLRDSNARHGRPEVNTDRIKGKWLQLKGDIRHRWGRLAGDEMDDVRGDAEKFIWKLQERYGYSRDPGRDLDEFVNSGDIRSKSKR
jgi:uncharacterized protein YjbJ (UPF0337 family)